jgi:hypothetical protein
VSVPFTFSNSHQSSASTALAGVPGATANAYSRYTSGACGVGSSSRLAITCAPGSGDGDGDGGSGGGAVHSPTSGSFGAGGIGGEATAGAPAGGLLLGFEGAVRGGRDVVTPPRGEEGRTDGRRALFASAMFLELAADAPAGAEAAEPAAMRLGTGVSGE